MSSEETTAEQPRWGEEDSEEFLGYGAYFVPERELQIETVCDLIPEPPAGSWLVELCFGEGLLTRALLERYPQCRVLGLDGSERMVEHARETLADHGDRVRLATFDLADPSWRDLPRPLHGVVSSLAVHHLDGEEKRQLFADVHRSLAPGGVLVLADLILPTHERGFRVAGKAWDRAVQERARALDGNLDAFEHFQRIGWNSFWETEPDPVDKPDTLLDQLKWLEAAGFTEVDAFWMRAGHVIFGGTKAG